VKDFRKKTASRPRVGRKCGDIAKSADRREKILSSGGFVLAELMVVVFLLSMFVMMAVMNLSGVFNRNKFKDQIQSFVATMQMAANGAAQSGRRYEVIINMTDQDYILREISSDLTSDILEDEVVVYNQFNENCKVVYIQFDDGADSDGDFQEAKFRAGHAGWQYGGKVVIEDKDGNTYSVLVKRLDGIVQLVEGNVDIYIPKAENEMYF
jgi:Tfp pilus assembly protein FimT